MTDNMMRVTFKTDFKNLDNLMLNMDQITNEAVRDTMENVLDNIHRNWSSESPSSPGERPAVVTGNLDKSIRILRRDSGGKFSTLGNAISWSLQVEAEYGAALEFGVLERNLAPRPFIRPAIAEAEALLGRNIAARLAFATSRFTVLNPFMAQRIYVGDTIGAMG